MALPDPVGHGLELWLDDDCQDPHDCALDDFVLDAGVPYGPLRPAVLLAPDPHERRRHLSMVAPPLMQVPPVVLPVRGLLRRRDVGHAWGTALLGLVIGFQYARLGDHVPHVVAPHRRRAPGLWGHALAWHGDGW